MKQKFLLFTFTLLSTMLFSQAQSLAFEDFKTTAGTQNLFLNVVNKTDSYGNIYTAGATVNGSGDYDIFIKKVNSSGIQLWQKQIPGVTGGTDFAAGMAVTDTYVILTGGISTSTANPTTDIFTMKLAASTGSVNWTSYYNGSGDAYDAAKHVVIDGSGNIYITGGGYNSSFNTDYVTLKYNSSGTQQWVNVWDYLGYDDFAIRVVASGSNLTITGAVSTATASVYKLATLTLAQSTGSLLATNVSTAITTSSVDVVSDVTADASSNIIIVGNNYVSGQGNNFYVQKLNPATLVSAWTYTWNGSSSLDDAAKAVQCDASSNIIIAGYSTSSTLGKELTILKLNSSGVLQYSVTSGFTGDDEAADLILDASGNAYVTGYNINSSYNKDYYTAKYSTTLTKTWEITADGNHYNDQATNIVLDSLNNVIVAGQSETAPGTYEYATYKYVQKDVITPTDFNGENPTNYFMFFGNKGQLINTNDSLVPDIKFYTYQTYPSFYFKDHSQSYVFSKIDTLRSSNDTIHRIDLNFTGSNETSKTYAMEQQKKGFLNYYLKHTGSEGVNNVLANKRLITTNLYNNIDLMTTNNQDGIKYYFIVKPGADMRNIKLEYTGASSYSLNGTTNALTINSTVGSLTFDKPKAYQLTTANATVAVTSFSPTWTTDGASNKYKFNDGSYTSSLTLVIEVVQKPITVSSPTATPAWGTFFGGTTGHSEAYDITVDKITGNLYTTGYCSSQNFPHVSGFDYQDWSGLNDAFMSFFDYGYEYQYTTLYGGTGIDKGNGVTYSSSNDKVYICGQTTGTTSPIMALNGSATTYTNTTGGNVTCFISRFNATDGKMEWSTRYGVDNGEGKKIKADANGNVYVVGDAQLVFTTTTTCLPNNSGYQPVCNPSGGAFYQPYSLSTASGYTNSTFYSDGYIARFNSQTALTWSTLFGGKGDEYMKDIHVDKVNNKLYIVGGTYSDFTSDDNCDLSASPATFPICSGGSTFYARNQINGNNTHSYSDGFLAKFNLTTLALEGCSYFGGSNEDVITDVVTDNNNNIFITGYSKSAFTTTNSATPNGAFPIIQSGSSYTHTAIGGYDSFVAKFNGGGQNLEWSTFIGSSGDDFPSGIDVNTQSDDVYTVGNSKNCNFPSVVAGGYFNQGGHADSPCSPAYTDGYVSNFSNYGGLRNSTYFGGKGAGLSGNYADNIAAVAAWRYRIYIGGGTVSSSNFPFANPGTFNPYVNTTYSPNRYRVFYGQISSDAVGIEELNKNHGVTGSMLIYPNPTNGKISFEWENTTSKKATVTIYNLMGQIINTLTLQESKGLNKEEINVSDLTFGLYLVVVKTETQTLNAKFIKE